MTTATDSMKDPDTADGLLDDSPAAGRSAGSKALCRVFVRPNRKSWPVRTQLLVIARHRRAASSKSR
jgi:hypothetical protein